MSRILVFCADGAFFERLSQALEKRDPTLELVLTLPQQPLPEWPAYDLCLVDSFQLKNLEPASTLPPTLCLVPLRSQFVVPEWAAGVVQVVEGDHEQTDLLAAVIVEKLEKQRLQGQLEALVGELEAARRVDELTGLATPLHFQNQLEHEIFRTERYGTPLTVILFELDGYNSLQRIGVDSGTNLLVDAAGEISRGLRNCDILANFGNGRFAALLSDTRLMNGVVVAEKLRRIVSALDGGSGGSSTGPALCTVSLAVIEYQKESGADSHKLMFEAERLLATAQASGGDCIRVAERFEKRPSRTH